MQINPTAGYRITLRVEMENSPEVLSTVVEVLGDIGAQVDEVRLAKSEVETRVHTMLVNARDAAHQKEVLNALRAVPRVLSVSFVDQVFALHDGGKIEIRSKIPVSSREDLSMAYTPGVGRVSAAIASDPSKVWDLTIKRNSVAVLSNGTAVLGLGNIGPEAAMPVMEGKALLFKQFADIDAYPICVDAPTADALVAVAQAIAPGFGGINLEDIAAPMCFEVERRLRESLDIPVFHDDQHGTAIVTLAALMAASKVVNKNLSDLRVAFLGAGAAGMACARLLLEAGVGDVVGVDRVGAIHKERKDLNEEKLWLAENANRSNIIGGIDDALRGADVMIGVSGPSLVKPEWVGGMAKDAIVFAMANPVPEIMPEELPPNVSVVATGRSDYPNQINNVLVFPGVFRGLLNAGAKDVTEEMKLIVASAIAGLVGDDLSATHIVPSPFDERVVPAVSRAIEEYCSVSGTKSTNRSSPP